jgi:hypothetical protein
MKNWVEICEQVEQVKAILRTSMERLDGMDELHCVLHVVLRILQLSS